MPEIDVLEEALLPNAPHQVAEALTHDIDVAIVGIGADGVNRDQAVLGLPHPAENLALGEGAKDAVGDRGAALAATGGLGGH